MQIHTFSADCGGAAEPRPEWIPMMVQPLNVKTRETFFGSVTDWETIINQRSSTHIPPSTPIDDDLEWIVINYMWINTYVVTHTHTPVCRHAPQRSVGGGGYVMRETIYLFWGVRMCRIQIRQTKDVFDLIWTYIEMVIYRHTQLVNQQSSFVVLPLNKPQSQIGVSMVNCLDEAVLITHIRLLIN